MMNWLWECVSLLVCTAQMLSKALLEAHSEAEAAGLRFAPEVFVAGRNRLENDGATALAEVISTVASLRSIQMPQNSIFHPGVAALAKAVLASPQLEVRRVVLCLLPCGSMHKVGYSSCVM